MKEVNSFKSQDSKSSIEDILNNMSQNQNLFQIKQLESKILTEKAYLENSKIKKEIKQKKGQRRPENCNNCNKHKKLKFCAFCGFYYCDKCFAKKRKSPQEPYDFISCCNLCEEIFLKIFLFQNFDEQQKKVQKEIDINEQIKKEMLKIYEKQNKELQQKQEEYNKTCQQLSDHQKQIQMQEEIIRKKIQKNKEEQESKNQSVEQEQALILQLEEQLKNLQDKYEQQQKLSQEILLENLNNESDKIKIQIKDIIQKVYTNKNIKNDVNIPLRQRTISNNQKQKVFFKSQIKVPLKRQEEKPQSCKCNIF